MIKETFIEELCRTLKGTRKVLIAGHVRPDGDSVGSCLAAALALKNAGIEPVIYYEGDTAHYPWLIEAQEEAGIASIDSLGGINEATKGAFTFMMLDLASPDRTGEAAIAMTLCSDSVCIDHHVNMGEYARINYICPEATSTSEVIFDLMKEMKVPITKSIALALFTGIAFDTGGFRHDSMRPEIFGIAAQLAAYDVPITKVMNGLFHTKSFREQRMLGFVLSQAKMYRGEKVIISEVNRADFLRMGAGSNDCESAVGALAETGNADVAVFLRELEPKKDQDGRLNQIRVNLRSKAIVDVAKVAAAFGGGGHVRAAGCTIVAPLLLAREMLLAEIDKQLQK